MSVQVPLKSVGGTLGEFAVSDLVSADGISPRSVTTLTLGGAATAQFDLVQGAVQVSALIGTADPSAGAGVAAAAGSTYTRQSGGTGEIWLKTGAADTAWEPLGPSPLWNGPLSATQLGLTELYLGSWYFAVGRIIHASSRALLGGAITTDTGTLNLRRRTTTTLVATFTHTGVLANTSITAGFTVAAADWYDLYLVAGGASETAVVAGLLLQ